jgi:NTE family protein
MLQAVGFKGMGGTDPLRDQIALLLHRLAPSSMRDPSVLEGLAGAARWLSVPGGQFLFRRGDPPDSLYFIVSGVLGVMPDERSAPQSIIARLGPGEVVGEVGCITGQPRNASVRALRSTELLAISWDDLERAATSAAEVLVSVCKTAIQRLTNTGPPRGFRPKAFSLLTGSEGIDLRWTGLKATAAFESVGRSVLITRDEFPTLTADQLSRLEAEYDYLVYIADGGDSPWTTFCLRQSDTVVVLARGGEKSRLPPEIVETRHAGIPIALILCWPDGATPAGTSAWLQDIKPARHFHWRGDADLRRAVRLLTGRGLGLVLSGGGARGLAHIGVVRAFQEHGLEVDIVMGTSIGSLIGAAVSLEWDTDWLVEQAYRFGAATLLSELTFPRLSLLAGRNIRRALLRWFKDVQIEDTPIPFSCVSTNLTRGEIAVHERGSLQTWIKASTAVPGVFPPVFFEDAVHVDGGVLNNMPTDLIRAHGAGFVVAVDVASNALPEDVELTAQALATIGVKPRNVIELLWRVCSIADDSQASTRRKQCDVLLVPQLENVGLLNFRAYQRAIEQGYHCTLRKIDALANRRPDRLDARAGLHL